MLSTVAEHLRAEAASDLDGLKATLAESPDYHLWADGRDYGPKGLDAVLVPHGDVVAVKRQILEFDIERIVVDHDTVVTEGWIHAINLGAVALCTRLGRRRRRRVVRREPARRDLLAVRRGRPHAR